MPGDVEDGGGLVRQAEPEQVRYVNTTPVEASGGRHEVAVRHRETVQEDARHRAGCGDRPFADV
ncbi:hypothetical protein [Virgisporangium aurantiacum]|uniref:Uncharacterized protein n=1 Tax=Virgisporangium aurantiacum TaxID=175570 RepID=A0A8J3Z3V8_9ACTN|nr:hypothetical protein [Virgisporangium aurantiacum]GIJ57031.1 hypothetical protein Vau01_045470 [Virgisporangium aurantiacum]